MPARDEGLEQRVGVNDTISKRRPKTGGNCRRPSSPHPSPPFRMEERVPEAGEEAPIGEANGYHWDLV